MKKILSFVFALVSATTLAFAATEKTVDCGTSVTLTATPKTGYHFVQWNDGDVTNPRTITASASATYTAQFAINEYTITFYDEDGTTILEQKTVKHGDVVTYTGATPTKASTAEFDYGFDSWSPNITTPATADANYTAVYTPTKRKYTVTFENYDHTILQQSEWEYGTTPVYSGADPTRPTEAGKSYTFSGWGYTTLPTVSGDVTYTAQFSSATESYTITVTADGAGSVTGGGTYLYGTSVELKATATDDCYEFIKWSNGDTNATITVTVTGVASYTAFFQKKQYTIKVVSGDSDMGDVKVE